MTGRYKPVGWRGEPHRHYLAAKGIKTNPRRYFKFTKDTTIPVIESPGNFKSIVRVEKQLMSPQEAESLLAQALSDGDVAEQRRFKKRATQRMLENHRQGKALPPLTIYYKKQDDGSWQPSGFDRDEVLFAALEAGVDEFPVVRAYRRPFKSTGFMKGEFEFSDREKELERKQREVMAKAGGFTARQTGNMIDIVPKDAWKLTDEERALLKDENIRETAMIDLIPDSEKYVKQPDEEWWS